MWLVSITEPDSLRPQEEQCRVRPPGAGGGRTGRWLMGEEVRCSGEDKVRGQLWELRLHTPTSGTVRAFQWELGHSSQQVGGAAGTAVGCKR